MSTVNERARRRWGRIRYRRNVDRMILETFDTTLNTLTTGLGIPKLDVNIDRLFDDPPRSYGVPKVESIFRSGGQQHEFGPRPRISR
jgi:hypothetical protein